LTLTCLVLQGFSLSVHHQNLTVAAAQGGLTTQPDTALSMNHFLIIFKRTSWHKQSPLRKSASVLRTLRNFFAAFA
jgi:hypothetical protein